jgi:hypothetical protein
MLNIEYHGLVDIAYWEYILAMVYVLVLYIYFARIKNVRIKAAPEYKYFIWGLWAKILGGVMFALIYFYYYKGGDTISYFYSAVSMSKLAKIDPQGFLTVLFGESSHENRRFFTSETGWPYGYMYFDPRTFFVIRIISPLAILTFDSYLVTTVVMASLSYFGIWRCYRTFVSYYPQLMGKLAIAFLFMPSVMFWGSAILKDTFTLSALCWFIHGVDEWYFKHKRSVGVVFSIAVSAVVMIAVKPYIFMAMVPTLLVWLLHSRITGLRSTFVKVVVVPIGVLAVIVGTVQLLDMIGESLDKFSLDKALDTVTITQGDMKRSEQYGENYFDVGELDGTWTGLLSKSHIAINAALFRPYLWESRNLVMLLSGSENFWILVLAVGTALRGYVIQLLRFTAGNPLVLMCMVFSLVSAFMVGISTPNFGALVRFKIPLIPLFVSALFILRYLYARKREADLSGRSFDLQRYSAGDPRPNEVKVPPHRGPAGSPILRHA